MLSIPCLAYTIQFYITDIFIVVRFSQRCFHDHIGCGITFTTISLKFLGNYLCANFTLLCNASGAGQSNTATTVPVLFYIWKCLIYITKSGEHTQVTCYVLLKMHLLLVLLLWDTMKDTYFFTDMQSK